ncbi:TetR/AcrR family transcriptional regulator [Neisseria sp. S1]|uniref:TetR/AcrR family transcriptional regulator n=1 Tax=Neisseria sp. S1 TaxID=3318354 RepID=UPI003A85C948
MSDHARAQFINAGLRLYPQYGYDKLSVRLLAAEAGLSPGMFHHLFADKNTFIHEVLETQHEKTFGRLNLAGLEGNALVKLKNSLQMLAFCIRDNLDWVRRAFADSGEGAEIVAGFWRQNFSLQTEYFLDLLAACGTLEEAEQVHRLAYLSSSVIGPMVIGMRLSEMGVLSDALGEHIPDILSDEAICRRIDWALAALFPDERLFSVEGQV